MKNRMIAVTILCLLFLFGCSKSKEPTFEEYFDTEMEKTKEEYGKEFDYSYSLVYKKVHTLNQHQDSIAIFTEHNPNGDQIFLAYFEKENGKWEWKQTRGAEWDSAVQWSSMNEEPYIYSGTLTDDSITDVLVGDEPAEIIEVEEGKRFWYAISDVQTVKVKAVKEDGREENVEEIDKELMEKEGKK
ncbi:hypothetical protein ACQKL5_08735 [Peribacillus sp. NPDC097675]|uniref:hypothetical protein n=1 Tax=Peribacillus sp. NPDC097675 TaxID=3390618 RepID=UPI003D070306